MPPGKGYSFKKRSKGKGGLTVRKLKVPKTGKKKK